MNILMLGRWLPAPGRREETRREYRLARQLRERHRVTLAFTTGENDVVGPVAALRAEFGDLEFAVLPGAWRALSTAVHMVTGQSRSVSYFRSEALRTRLAHRLAAGHFDLVYVSSSSMMPYAVELDPHVPVVVDFGEVDSEWWAQEATARAFPAANFCQTEAARLRLAEAAAARRAVHCIVASPEAARALAARVPEAAITVIPNGVDQDHFAPLPQSSSNGTVAIVGWLENAESVEALARFCLTAVPAVRAARPGLGFVVASRNAPITARRLAEIAGIEIVTPLDDVRPLLRQATLAAAPLPRGRRSADGIVEAMLMGLPVVATSGAVDGLGAVSGRDLFVQDNPSAFAHEAIHLLASPVLRAEVAASGQAFARARYSWEAATSRLAELIEAPIRQHKPPQPLPIQPTPGPQLSASAKAQAVRR